METTLGIAMRRIIPIIVCYAALLAAGCGFPQAKLDEAKAFVVEGLGEWKKGVKLADLKTQPKPLAFFDPAWAGGDALAEFEILRTYYHDREKMIRVVAKLTLRPVRGPERVEEVTYDVTLGPPHSAQANPMP